jgi:2-oxoglutarate ferredoxin oxidoreductase subunit alpha
MKETSYAFSGDLSIVLSGEAGQGIQTIESMLTSFAKKSSYGVFATKEYMSRVRGGCNSTEILLSRNRVSSRVDRIDVLVALTPGAIPHLKRRITDRTLVLGEKETVVFDGLVDMPFSAIARDVGGSIFSNTVAVGAICALAKLDRELCEASTRAIFASKGAEIGDKNVLALDKGYELGLSLASRVSIDIGKPEADPEDIMLTGAESVSFGALAGGCNYVCAYPMSPGTTVLTTMAEQSKKFDLLVEQVEDEIGVANMAIGAWYAGARALVTTSGGGFALMSEAMSLAGMIETPFVAHIAQRPGPATGLPTRTEQGDLDLAIHSGHGDFLKIVLAPGDLAEGYELGKAAFDLADRFQSPVLLLTDQYYVDSYYTTEAFEVDLKPLSPRVVTGGPGYRRYALGSSDGISPRALPGLSEGLVCVDSDEHDEDGRITEDPEVRKAMVKKRLAKIHAAQAAAIPPRLYGGAVGGAYEHLLLGWGSVKGPVLAALAALGRKDIAFLHFPWVYPLPAGVSAYLERARSVFAVEGNATGQLADLVEAETGRRLDGRILKFDGFQFSVEELADRISSAFPKGASV